MNIYIPLTFPDWVFYYCILCYIVMGLYLIETRKSNENKWLLSLLLVFAPITVPIAIIVFIVMGIIALIIVGG